MNTMINWNARKQQVELEFRRRENERRRVEFELRKIRKDTRVAK
jgi:hypothetical protein